MQFIAMIAIRSFNVNIGGDNVRAQSRSMLPFLMRSFETKVASEQMNQTGQLGWWIVNCVIFFVQNIEFIRVEAATSVDVGSIVSSSLQK